MPGLSGRTRPRRAATLGVALVAVCSAALSACASDEADAEADTGTWWQRLDPCALLTEDQVTQALGLDRETGQDAGQDVVAEADDADPRRPKCTWSTDRESLEVMLWRPPSEAVLTEGKSTVPVGEHTGYVQGGQDSRCFLQVDADGFWLLLDLDATAEAAAPDFCGTHAAAVAALVIDSAHASG
ncbi:hypothetical protein KG112_03605 [Nocardioides sp. zg-ZUI104]|uniref:hypothetical protein n=1 Tax=Nocardioides faecalis TaxID=2803858 RepID=UPI001BCF3F66|nr:hypothetical protein [Nocardioides faecalis]MBS4751893.1 hypothetical protein [Nocardioides faecalis]